MTSYHDATNEELIEVLKEYVDEEYIDIVDFEHVLKSAEENKQWEDVTFNLLFGKIILNTKDLSYKDAEPAQPLSYQDVHKMYDDEEYEEKEE